jgi:dTDP-4-dehydrorhamnose reductase
LACITASTRLDDWSGLARELAQLIHRPDAAIIDVPMASASLVAPRPKFAALSNDKLAAQGIAMPTWQDALRRHIENMQLATNN